MKKVLVFVLCSCMLGGMIGCGKKQEETAGPSGSLGKPDNSTVVSQDPEDTENEDNNIPGVKPDVYDNSRILEKAHEEIKTEYGTTVYSVPNLDDDTVAAREINDEINEDFLGMIQEDMDCFAEYEYTNYAGIMWDAYWTGSVVSLVVHASYYGAYDYYRVFHYDYATGKRLENHDILALCNMSAEEFVWNAKRTVANSYDEQYSNMEYVCDENGIIGIDYVDWYYDSLLMYRVNTINDVNDEDAMIFLKDGILYMIVKTYIPAGAGETYYPEEVMTVMPNVSKEVSFEFINAKLENGTVTVSFADTDDARAYLTGGISEVIDYQVRFNYDYVVEGTFSNYTDIALYPVGMDYYPTLFLVTETGRLEFVNVIRCAEVGFFVASPIPYTGNVERLEPAVADSIYDMEINTVRFLADGKWYDIMDWYLPQICAMEEYNCADCTWNLDGHLDANGVEHSLTVDLTEYLMDYSYSVKFYDVNMATYEGTVWNGFLNFLGADDKGLVFAYFVTPTTGDYTAYEGSLRISIPQYGWDKMTFQILTGYELFDNDYRPCEFVRGVG